MYNKTNYIRNAYSPVEIAICRDEKRFLCISFRNIQELKSNRPLVAQDKSIYTWGHTLWRIPSATNRVSRSQSTRFNPTSLLSPLSLRRSFPFDLFFSFYLSFFFFLFLHTLYISQLAISNSIWLDLIESTRKIDLIFDFLQIWYHWYLDQWKSIRIIFGGNVSAKKYFERIKFDERMGWVFLKAMTTSNLFVISR